MQVTTMHGYPAVAMATVAKLRDNASRLNICLSRVGIGFVPMLTWAAGLFLCGIGFVPMLSSASSSLPLGIGFVPIVWLRVYSLANLLKITFICMSFLPKAALAPSTIFQKGQILRSEISDFVHNLLITMFIF